MAVAAGRAGIGRYPRGTVVDVVEPKDYRCQPEPTQQRSGKPIGMTGRQVMSPSEPVV